MTAFPRTRAVAVRICQDWPGDRDRPRALALLKRLRDSETALTREDRTPAMMALLRDMVLRVRELAGPGWITARAASPEVAAFTALDLMPQPPPPAELDQVLAGVLQVRFAARYQPGTEVLGSAGPGLPATRPRRPVPRRQTAGL